MAGILRLDDGCLMRILEHLAPLPDRFNLARTCKRLSVLTKDARLWLSVTSEGAHAPSKSPSQARVFFSLTKAVEASRPGDTIAVGGVHSLSNLVIEWPLLIQGSSEESHHLLCKGPADSALDVRASMRIVNVSITARLSACILHRSGHLQVESCHLTCEPKGLAHLCSPLVTLASEVAGHVGGYGRTICSGAGGKLTVMDTRIEGGARAVNCHGTGSLSGVRVVYRTNSSNFWFDVDSRSPGKALPTLVFPAQSTICKRDFLAVGEHDTYKVKRKKEA